MIIDQNGIYLTKKQASVSAAVLVVLALLLFVGGYFWGKQSVIDGFTQKTSQESFNDQVDYLLTMQSFAAKNGGVAPGEIESEKESTQSLPDAAEECEKTSEAVPVSAPGLQEKTSKSYKHYAALAGFSKKALAEQLAQRLKKRNIPVQIKTKVGKSASGKARRTWYQVITMSYESVEEVQQIVVKILTFEKIKRSDIKIV
ncbi:hypothetical protein A3J41_00350 [candidate division TM6 bacterium RIFCSPHIGHO2_12_FULL_38_8]|nr:MAG: hypothetical protein A3J41_00350 [candidate division TM6 bacterium RIFCSPHIGHO2_12_FULL_38_8]